MKVDWKKVQRRLMTSEKKRYGLRYDVWDRMGQIGALFMMGVGLYLMLRYYPNTDKVPMLLGGVLGLYGIEISTLIEVSVARRRIRELGGDMVANLEKEEHNVRTKS